MVNSGTVQSNRDHFVQCLDTYQSEIQGLTGSWEGLSYDQFISRAEEVVSEYSAISSQLSDFAQACDKYEEYMVNKTNKENALQSADVNRDNASIARNSAELNATADTQEHDAEYYQNNMNRLKAEINSLLSSASSKSFTADPIANHAPNFSFAGAPTQTASDALNWALQIAADNRYAYVRGGVGAKSGGYDCTQFVQAAYNDGAGVSLPEMINTNERSIVQRLSKLGFTWTQGRVDPSQLLPGDILVDQDHHAVMYAGDGNIVGAENSSDGILVRSYYNPVGTNREWDGYLRYTG